MNDEDEELGELDNELSGIEVDGFVPSMVEQYEQDNVEQDNVEQGNVEYNNCRQMHVVQEQHNIHENKEDAVMVYVLDDSVDFASESADCDTSNVTVNDVDTPQRISGRFRKKVCL